MQLVHVMTKVGSAYIYPPPLLKATTEGDSDRGASAEPNV